MLKLALLGSGQLGGSFALAVHGSGTHITAYDAVAAHAEQLKKIGAVDEVAATAQDAARDADIVMLAAPLRSYRPLAKAITPVLKAGAIVTDLGSVKAPLLALSALLPQARLVGAHPIAGSEKSGPGAANGALFRGRLCILTPDEATDAAALKSVETLWQLAGADLLQMPAAVHDQVYAHVSHLPHVIAFVAASYYHRIGARIGVEDAGLQQFLRIGRSNPRMWCDIALENREALLPALATYIAVLDHFAGELRAGESVPSDSVAVAKQFLPRLLAASLISSVSLYEKQSGMDLRGFGAGGMRDIVAPAATAPEGDMEAISHAAAALADALDALILQFHTLETLIGAEDEAGLLALITGMVADAHALAEVRQ